MKVVIVALLFEIAEEGLRIFVGPVGKDHDVLPIAFDRMFVPRIDNERAILSGLFLEPAVAVIPIGAALADWKAVDESFARRDSGEAQAGYAVHICGDPDSVPVNRGRRFQAVRDGKGHGVAFPPSQGWSRNGTVNSSGVCGTPGEIHRNLLGKEVEVVAG